MKSLRRSSLIAGSFFLVTSGVAHAATIIDDFTVGPATIVANQRNFNRSIGQVDLDAQHLLLGQRVVTLQGDMEAGSVQVDIHIAGNGALAYSPDSPVFSDDNIFNRAFDGRVILRYLPGDRFTSHNLLELVDGDTFAIDVLESDFGTAAPFPVAIGLNGRREVARFELRNSAEPYTVRVPFSALQVNPSELTSTRDLTFDFGIVNFVGIPPDASFSLESIRVVPEPAAGVLMMLLLSGGLARQARARFSRC